MFTKYISTFYCTHDDEADSTGIVGGGGTHWPMCVVLTVNISVIAKPW